MSAVFTPVGAAPRPTPCGVDCEDLEGAGPSAGVQLKDVEWALLELAAHRGEWMHVDTWLREDVGSMSALAQALRRRGILVVTRKDAAGMMQGYAMMPV